MSDFKEGDCVAFIGGNVRLDNGDIVTAGQSGYIVSVLKSGAVYLVEFEVQPPLGFDGPNFSHAEIDDEDLIYGD